MYKLLIISTIVLLSSCFSTPTDEPIEDVELLQIWSVNHGTAGDAPPIIHEDKLIMSGGLFVYALKEETGEEIWKSQFEVDNILQGRIFLINGAQVVAAHTDKIRAWNIFDGNLDWEFDYEAMGQEPRLIGKHISFENKYGFSSELSRFFTLDKSGNIGKVTSLDNKYGVQGLAYSNNKIFIGQAQTVHGALTLGRITSFDSNSGDSLWAYDTENGGFSRAAPIVEDGIVYAGTSGNSEKNVYLALDAETGAIIWEYITYDPGKWTRNFTIGPKHLFFAGDARLFALHKSTGELAWEYSWEGSAFVQQVYLEGYVYHSDHGSIFVLDAETGELVHRQPGPEGGGYIWHLAVSEDKLFVQSSYKLVAYQPWHLREE